MYSQCKCLHSESCDAFESHTFRGCHMSQLSSVIFVAPASPAGDEACRRAQPQGAMAHVRGELLQEPALPPASRFPSHERNHLLLARGVGPGLVELLEATGFSSLDKLRRAGAPVVMASLTQRFGTRMRGYSTRALSRAVASFVCNEATQVAMPRGATAVRLTQARPLMVDIARAAGVAPSTVSRALNDSDRVNRQTKERIREIARTARYSRNAIAQSLRHGRARTVALLLPDISPSECCPVQAQVLALINSLADALNMAGFQLSCMHARADSLVQVREILDSALAGGIVAIGVHPGTHVDLPMVLWDGPQSGATCPTVTVDAAAGTRLAARLLLDQGARRLIFLADRDAAHLQAQLRGFLQAHQELGLVPATNDVVFVHRDGGFINPCALALESGRWPDGIVAASDWCALSALQVLRGAGLRVPEDVVVVGFGDTPLAVQGALALSSVRLPMVQGGQALAKLLLDRMAGRTPASVVLTPQLVIRASTGPRGLVA